MYLMCKFFRAQCDAHLTSRIELKQCLQMLHAQRIAHGDLQLRHLRISPYTSKLNLIDFSHSTLDASDEMLEQEDEWVLELVG